MWHHVVSRLAPSYLLQHAMRLPAQWHRRCLCRILKQQSQSLNTALVDCNCNIFYLTNMSLHLESFVWLLASEACPLNTLTCPSPAPEQIAIIVKTGARLHHDGETTDLLFKQLQSGCCVLATRSQFALNPMLTAGQLIKHREADVDMWRLLANAECAATAGKLHVRRQTWPAGLASHKTISHLLHRVQHAMGLAM